MPTMKKFIREHEAQCQMITVTCEACKTAYRRCDAATHHSDVICATGQLRELRITSQNTQQQFEEQGRLLQEANEQLRESQQENEQLRQEIQTLRASNQENMRQRTRLRLIYRKYYCLEMDMNLVDSNKTSN